MAHMIDSMAYAGEVPWHGLGTKLDADADSATMLAAAGLEWEALKVPAFYMKGDAFERVPGQYTLTRSDTGASLGCAVGVRYVPFQNAALFAFGDALRAASSDGVRWHTAGALQGGARIWALAQLAGSFEVKRSATARARIGQDADTAAQFLLLMNSHGGASLLAQSTSVRVVCANTLAAAMAEKDQPHYRIRHTASMAERVEDAAEALGLAATHFAIEREVSQGLADTPMDRRGFADFVAQLLTGEDDRDAAREAVASSEGRSRAIFDRKGGELVGLFEHGKGNAGVDRFDALNAVTEYIDHQRNRVRKWRTLDQRAQGLDSAWFGEGARIKQRAVALLTR